MSELLKLYGSARHRVVFIVRCISPLGLFRSCFAVGTKIYSKVFFNQDPEKPVSVDKLLKHFENIGRFNNWPCTMFGRIYGGNAKMKVFLG